MKVTLSGSYLSVSSSLSLQEQVDVVLTVCSSPEEGKNEEMSEAVRLLQEEPVAPGSSSTGILWAESQ
ncbi:unnamed protein product [Lampetra planeri]